MALYFHKHRKLQRLSHHEHICATFVVLTPFLPKMFTPCKAVSLLVSVCRQHSLMSDMGRIPWCAGITSWHQ